MPAGAFTGEAGAPASSGVTWGDVLGGKSMPQRAVSFGRVVVGAVSHAVQHVLATSAIPQVVHMVIRGVPVAVADIHAIRPGADECFGYEGVDVALLLLALDAEVHARVSVFIEGSSQELSLAAVDLAV